MTLKHSDELYKTRCIHQAWRYMCKNGQESHAKLSEDRHERDVERVSRILTQTICFRRLHFKPSFPQVICTRKGIAEAVEDVQARVRKAGMTLR